MTAGSLSKTATTQTPLEFELHLGLGWMTSETSLVKYVNTNDANGYYKALGLTPDATKEAIKLAYHRLVKKFHPDIGGDEELYRFVVEIASVLLSSKKRIYDSVEDGAIYLGDMEREELARAGVIIIGEDEKLISVIRKQHWACLTTSGFVPGIDTDVWIDFCRQASSAVGYRGKIRVGVVEIGQYWPCDPMFVWGTCNIGSQIFILFQRGIEPNRLHALCAMIHFQKHLLNQMRSGWSSTQDREKKSWP